MNKQPSMITNLHATWKNDFLASIVVFLVTIPLSTGIAIASGVPIEKAASIGLITAIIGGIVVGSLSGSPLQKSGPSAGLSVLVFLFIQKFGFEALGIIVLIAGLIQLVAGLMRLEKVFRSVSPALIQGMLGGIGILIIASQIHVMVDNLPPGTGKNFGGIINLRALPQALWLGISETAHRPSTLIGLLTITCIMLWTTYAPKSFKFMPATLIGVVIAIACAALLDPDVKYVPSPAAVLDGISWPTTVWSSLLMKETIWLAGLSLAFVACAEIVLTATAVDSMQFWVQRTAV